MTTQRTFPAAERAALLAVKGVGPTVVTRLEPMGIASLADLARREAAAICAEASAILGSTCRKNSPQARRAIEAAIAAARLQRGRSQERRQDPVTPAAVLSEAKATSKRALLRDRARTTTTEPRAR